MRKFIDDKSGQMILLACVSVVAAMVLIATYEYSTLETGESSINRENKDSFYFYTDIRDRYVNIYKDDTTDYLNLSNPVNITIFEKELKEFALLHGYSVEFMSNYTQARIIFVDKDLEIDEIIYR